MASPSKVGNLQPDHAGGQLNAKASSSQNATLSMLSAPAFPPSFSTSTVKSLPETQERVRRRPQVPEARSPTRPRRIQIEETRASHASTILTTASSTLVADYHLKCTTSGQTPLPSIALVLQKCSLSKDWDFSGISIPGRAIFPLLDVIKKNPQLTSLRYVYIYIYISMTMNITMYITMYIPMYIRLYVIVYINLCHLLHTYIHMTHSHTHLLPLYDHSLSPL